MLTYEGLLAAGRRGVPAHDGPLRHAGGEGSQREVRTPGLD